MEGARGLSHPVRPGASEIGGRQSLSCSSGIVPKALGRFAMTMIPVQPVVSLIAGILILLMPSLLNYVVAVYLIVIGIVGLIH
jgi:hypothetical protein